MLPVFTIGTKLHKQTRVKSFELFSRASLFPTEARVKVRVRVRIKMRFIARASVNVQVTRATQSFGAYSRCDPGPE